MSSSTPIAKANNTIRMLDQDHGDVFCRAFSNLLSTDIAEHTYAQILDGLPTEDSLLEGSPYIEGHPVSELEHTPICEGFLEKSRRMHAALNPYDLQFDEHILSSFQEATKDSEEYSLRLIELTVVACHQIAVYLFNLDDGVHKHQLYEDWAQQRQMEQVLASEVRDVIPPCAFFHTSYYYFDQYPQGLADVVGYWAEGQIFGGVVVFDRGETEAECKSMWIHGARLRGPRTLYPPTPDQFDSLINFLLSEPKEEAACPLPIHGINENRPRWHPYDALAKYHIFRDKYERKLPMEPPRQGCTLVNADWPELGDE
ncbi:hypothetical protein HYE67_000893 [Fusarium culmorum]|uniref:Uncharacterized protein n=1 Tax=Fusarium culmorum TaxID=5516 RepID=A0A7S8HRH3_FUSCU|nr:hypothetical protein HYE67_000893 [Fusarium culmorum]